MGIEEMLIKEIERSGDAKVIDVPEDKKLTPESLAALESEIAAQVRINEKMRFLSMHPEYRR